MSWLRTPTMLLSTWDTVMVSSRIFFFSFSETRFGAHLRPVAPATVLPQLSVQKELQVYAALAGLASLVSCPLLTVY